MGIQKKGLGVLCLLLTLCLLLSGCRESSSLVRYDISNGVESLDPQFASEENEQLVIYNTDGRADAPKALRRADQWRHRAL